MGQVPALRHACSAVLCFLVCQLTALGATNDLPETTLRTTVSEVRITFSVTDQNNHAVATLTPADLAVVDKDIIVRKFQSFTHAEFTRLDMAVLVDRSQSVRSTYRAEIAQIVALLSKPASVPEPSLSIVSFHGLQPTLLCKGDCRAIHAADVIPQSPSGDLTPLYDSLIFAARALSENKDPQTRRVVVLFSDGEDTISQNSTADAMHALTANDIQVYTVDMNRSGPRGSAFLQVLASATAGRTFRLADSADKVANAVLDDFHASYQLTYKLPFPSTGFHTIRILPTHDMNLHFRCRRGYLYPSPGR